MEVEETVWGSDTELMNFGILKKYIFLLRIIKKLPIDADKENTAAYKGGGGGGD